MCSRSARSARSAEEVQLNLGYRWFCGLGIEDKIPDHSAFTRARNERFRSHDVFRVVFERVVATCIQADLVGGNGFAVDASLIAADANKCRSTPGDKWNRDIDPATVKRAVQDYLANLDDPAWGAATDVVPKFVAPADPAAQSTGALRNAAFFAYADNYLIDVKFGIIMDVEASRAIRQAEVGASQTMIERTEATFGIKPDWLVADTAYGAAPNLHFLVDEKGIEPHVPVIDKSKRDDGTFSREDFNYDDVCDCYVCPNDKVLPRSSRKRRSRGDDMISYFSRVADCRSCPLKSTMPSEIAEPEDHAAHSRGCARCRPRDRQNAGLRADATRSQEGRDVVRPFEAHSTDGAAEAEGPVRRAVRVYARGHRPEPRRLAKLTFHPPDTVSVA